MILDESREVQEAFLATRAPLKRSQSEDLTTSKKHPLGAIGTHKIIPKSTNLLCQRTIFIKIVLWALQGASLFIYGAKHSPSSSAQKGPKGKIKVSTQKWFKSTSHASFQQSKDPQTKLENKYDQNTLKFHKIMILAPYVSTGARQLTNGGENEVRNDKIMENFENLRNDPG